MATPLIPTPFYLLVSLFRGFLRSGYVPYNPFLPFCFPVQGLLPLWLYPLHYNPFLPLCFPVQGFLPLWLHPLQPLSTFLFPCSGASSGLVTSPTTPLSGRSRRCCPWPVRTSSGSIGRPRRCGTWLSSRRTGTICWGTRLGTPPSSSEPPNAESGTGSSWI